MNTLNNCPLIPVFVAVILIGSAQAADYTWTGAAADGDWTNSANWDANGIPVDTDTSTSALDQQTQNDNIIINGGDAPSLNIPEFAGGNAFDRSKDNTPEIQILLGTMTVSAGTWNNQGQVHNGSWSSSVGDGDTDNGLAELNYNIIQGAGSGLNRDDNSLMAWTVNADGTLNIDYTPGATLRMAYSSTRTIGFNLAGGTVNIADALDLDGHAGNFFDLTAAGASVTANFGGDFADLAAVNTAIGTHFISTTGETLTATDNTDGTFTVTTTNDSDPPTPDPMTFAVAPASLNGTTIGMTATTATDLLSSSIEYYFENVTATTNSGWISDTIWDSTGLTAGVSYDFRIKARDGAGNETQWSAVASATPVVDTTAPTVGSLSPANGASSIVPDADLVLTFSEDVVAATGFITLKNLTDATQVQIDVTDGSQVSIAGGVLTINPAADFELGKQYAVQIDANAFQDLAGTPNPFAGIADDSTWNFTTSTFPPNSYIWTGGAEATPWYDSDNWTSGDAPTQGTSLGTPEQDALVVFDSETATNSYMPTDTITVDADWNSSEHLMPAVQVLNGTITLAGPGGNWWHYGGGNVFQVGDGDMTTAAQVNTSFTNWVRHLDKGGKNLITINADGTINQTANFQFGQNGDTEMTLNGGTFISSGTITGLATRAGSLVNFNADGSTFTAPFGDGVSTDFADLAAVNAEIGNSFVDNTGGLLLAVDNGDGTFTVGFLAGSITAFEAAGVPGTIDQTARTIDVEVPFGTNLATLAPSFTLSSGTCDQTSGAAPAPSFADQNPATYTVTDTSTDPDTVNEYTVTVTVAPQIGTLVIDLGAGTAIEGGTFDTHGTNLPLPSLPAGSFLRSIAIDTVLESTDNGTDGNWASDLSILLDPTPGTPGDDFAVEITNGTDAFGATVSLGLPTDANAGPGTALVDTKTDADFGTIDLATTGIFLGNAFTATNFVAGQGGTWSGTITLTYDIPAGGGDYTTWAAGFLPDDVSNPNGDFDKDGLTNAQERAFGLDPTDPASVDSFVVPIDAGGTFSYTRRDPALSGLTYTIWTSPDLENWTEDTGAVQTPGTVVNAVHTVAVTTSATAVGGKLFVQVRAN